MVDYAKLYHIMCRAASGALEALELREENLGAINILRLALEMCENLYIRDADKDENADAL